MTQQILVSQVKEDPELQPRIKMDHAVVKEYAEAMTRGDSFPAIVVFDVPGEGFLLVDGYHRLHAAQENKWRDIEAEIKSGSRRDAILYSLQVNEANGIRRTNEDKRRAVRRLLDDQEWATWNNQKIAEVCRVSDEFVRKLRDQSSTNVGKITERKVERGGKTYTMDTGKIGKRSPQETPKPDHKDKNDPKSSHANVQESDDAAFKQVADPSIEPDLGKVEIPDSSSLGERELRAKAFVETLDEDGRSVLNRIIAAKGLRGYYDALNLAIRCARREVGIR